MRLFVCVSPAILRLRAFTKEREKELWLGSNMFLCMVYPVTLVFLFAVHLARFLYSSRSLCSFHKSMSQTRHAPWLLLLITEVTGGWLRHVSFYNCTFRTLHWLEVEGKQSWNIWTMTFHYLLNIKFQKPKIISLQRKLKIIFSY